MGDFFENSVYFEKSKLYFLKSKPYFFQSVLISEKFISETDERKKAGFACEASREGAVKDLLHPESRMESGM